MKLQETLQWRYATKKYDPSRKVSQENVDAIVEAARLAPTSSGLQPFRLLVISNQELKEKIVPIASGQQIVADSSHLIVFAAWDNYTEARIDTIYNRIETERSMPKGAFKDYTDRLKSGYLPRSAEENFQHAARQAYIGLGMALAQAAELQVDSTPMEGFDNAQLDALLDLPTKGLRSVLMMPLGYRDAANDWLVNLKKVRNTSEEFVTYLD